MGHLTFSELSAIYVATSCVSTVCYGRHMSPYRVLSLCATGDICCRSYISLNFAGLLSIVVRISRPLSKTSRNENDEAFNTATFNMFTEHSVEFERRFCSKTDHFMGNLGANTIEHVSEMELYNILSTFEKSKRWNCSFNHKILACEMVSSARSSPIVHIDRFFQTINKYFHYFTQHHGHATPKRTKQ